MSITAPPARGYADWQRNSNFDSGSLYSNGNITPPATVITPVIDVSRYAYLGGIMQCTSGALRVFITWCVDQTFTHLSGTRSIVLSASINNPMELRLPNLGPFVQLQFIDNTGGGSIGQAQLFGTNRYHPLELIPVNPVLIDQQNSGVAGNATVTFYPLDYYAGPVSAWCLFGQAGQLTFKYLTTGNNWDDFYQVNLGANTEVPFQLATPPGAWRCEVLNQSAVATGVFLAVVPPTTGAV